MSFTVTDPVLLAGLRQAGDVVELKDPDGHILGTFAGAELGRLPPGDEVAIFGSGTDRAAKEPDRSTVGRYSSGFPGSMMNYTVQFDPPAEQDLAGIWTASADKKAVTEAAAWLEVRLTREPLRLGESRSSSVHRVVFRNPLGFEYEVVEDDKLVLVHAVFAIGCPLSTYPLALGSGGLYRISLSYPAPTPSRAGPYAEHFSSPSPTVVRRDIADR